MRIQLSLINPDMRESCKNESLSVFSQKRIFENIVIFHKNMSLMLTYNRFVFIK